ncbi:MAG TPA: chalcone isomerase family protein [Azonexus sp.]
MSSSLNLPIGDFVAPGPGWRGGGSAVSGALPVTANRQPASAERRAFLLALGTAALVGLPPPARADADLLAGLKRWGSGEFRRFGFLVYEATLWAGDDPQRPPLALRLDYKRTIEGKAIADASIKEMRRFVSDEAALRQWGERMRGIFPDVKPGDHILGVYRPDGARFYQEGRLLGSIEQPAFAEAFFAIWLDARTSAPDLRMALLRRPGA